MKVILWFSSVTLCLHFVCYCAASDTLKPRDILRFNETLESAGGMFELGFFSSFGSSSNHYLGIWFKNDKYKKAVWVANRENPIMDSSGYLSIRYDGNIVIIDRRLIPIIVNYGLSATNNNTKAMILDSGNFILVEGEKIIWQSFDYPCDTFLPGMKLGSFGLSTENQRKQFLVSWVSPFVPTTGPFVLGLNKKNMTQLNVWYRDVFRDIGFWDGHDFRFFFEIASENYNFTFVFNTNEIYLTFDARGKNMPYFVLTSTGEINECTSLDQGIKVIKRKLCKDTLVKNGDVCLIPVLNTTCQNNEEFSEIIGSIPNSMVVNGSIRMGPSDCEIMCRSNCSCAAYASFRDDGTGCELYYGEKRVLGTNNGITRNRIEACTNAMS